MKRIFTVSLVLLIILMASIASAATFTWTDPVQPQGDVYQSATIVCTGTKGTETAIASPACPIGVAISTPCVICTATTATTCTATVAPGSTIYCAGYITDTAGVNSPMGNEVSLAEPFPMPLPPTIITITP